jgi:bifunctional DNA-binding transcriptional regulator/antitoxin component of YhaV-PrlF toxin-antitoxin module
MTKTSWTLTPTQDPETGDLVITFPEDLLAQAGWKPGDEIVWTDLSDGSYQLIKKLIPEVSTPEEEEAWQELDKKLKEKQNDKNQ